jgi:hypothetical protein
MPVVVSDSLFDLRSWLRSHPDLQPLHGGRVFFRVPDRGLTAPFMRLYRVGGGPQPNTDAPESDLRFAIEVWGLQFADYPVVRQLVNATESAFLQAESVVSGGTLIQYANVTAAVDAPDPDTGWPRFVVDVVATLRALNPPS